MLYLVFARDRASQTILKRETREAAELREARWFDVQITENAAKKAA